MKIDNLDFDKAIKRIKKDKNDDPIHDITGYRDYLSNKDEFIDQIKTELTNISKYNCKREQSINIPKIGFSLRSAVLPNFKDRILYQVIADHLQEYYQPEENVYSNLPKNKKRIEMMFVPGIKSWLNFQSKNEQYAHDFPYMIETDITAYFDHINHRVLNSRINDLFQIYLDDDVIEDYKYLLRKMWGKWGSPYLNDFGIPQMNDPSSFFGNLYLDEIDKWLVSKTNPSLRYVDDLRIFSNSIPEARNNLAELVIRLRRMGLYISTAKTKICSTEKVLIQLHDRRNTLDIIESKLKNQDIESINDGADLLCDLFENIINDTNEFDDRLFRFCIHRFKKFAATDIRDDIYELAIQEVLNRLSSMPNSTDVFVDYLSMFPNNEFIHQYVINFLLEEYNIYEWQEALLLELLIRSNLSDENFNILRPYITHISKNCIGTQVFRKAIVLWGKNGNYADKKEIRSLFSQVTDIDDQRSIIFALQEMETRARNFFYSQLSDVNERRYTIEYIKKLSASTYHYFNPCRGYEIFYDDYLDNDSDDLSDLGSEYFL